MRVLLFVFFLLCFACPDTHAVDIPFGQGTMVLTLISDRAVRVQYHEGAVEEMPEWVYVCKEVPAPKVKVKNDGHVWTLTTPSMRVNVDTGQLTLSVCDEGGHTVFCADQHQLTTHRLDDADVRTATLAVVSPRDECLYGLGQFQDGFLNVRGLSRRLTQVNTQIAVPMVVSDKGYGLLWNNYGMTEFNPASHSVALRKSAAVGDVEIVNVTSTEGGRQERREKNEFEAVIDIPQAGEYSLLLDVGQKMARRHHLCVDGKTVMDMQNLWLPPTASQIVHLEAGRHTVKAQLANGDQPVLYYGLVQDKTVFRSPVAQQVDYTVFVGSADQVIAEYRHATGQAPMMPRWALGYIHCRERFHSQDELLTTARRFREEHLPVDVIVQDWQYWGKHGWNSMRFDEDHYPRPAQMVDSLHRMNMRLMLSVWSKIDKNSEVGRMMQEKGFYIPETDWIDFFNPEAAKAYWRQFSQRLLPIGIDAWWQDATEPENDDLVGRRVMNGKYQGEVFRNVYPLLVNKTVCEGLLNDRPGSRPMILTRCGFPGIQRYGSVLWSGDVGNDWETLRRQITAGLGLQAAGIPWWTYDAGGFFRPQNQYADNDYIERMLRWIETAVYLPLMRVHGYMSNTEPWNYGPEAKEIIAGCLSQRYRLLPYIYSNAYEVSSKGATLMRPLIFDFPADKQALRQNGEYMFGKALLVSPVTQPAVGEWSTYLPDNKAGWYDFNTGSWYQGAKVVSVPVDKAHIPVFAKGGSIVILGPERQYTAQAVSEPYEVKVFPGADASFTLYEDDGVSSDDAKGEYSLVSFQWNDRKRVLTISALHSCKNFAQNKNFSVVLPGEKSKTVSFKGKKIKVNF